MFQDEGLQPEQWSVALGQWDIANHGCHSLNIAKNFLKPEILISPATNETVGNLYYLNEDFDPKRRKSSVEVRI